MIKVCIGLVLAHGFPVPAPFVISYSHLLQSILTGSGNALLPPKRRIDTCRAIFGQDFPIDWARNRIVKIFLDESDADYLVFLDTDMTHPPDTIHRLVAHDKDVVTGRYVMRKPPHFTVAMRKVGVDADAYQAIEKLLPYNEVKGLMPIDAAGAGVLLMSRKVLATIRAKLGRDDWFRYQDGPDGQLRSRSEDMWFYEQASACGFQPYLDADLNCGHIGSFELDYRNHAPYRDQFLRQEAERRSHEEIGTRTTVALESVGDTA